MKRICIGPPVLTAGIAWAVIGQWNGARAGEPAGSFDSIAQTEVAQTDAEDRSEDEADTLRIIVTAERTPDTPQDVH